MGVRRWLWNVLARGETPVRDPDELVETALVSASQAPLMVALLERHRIEAVAVEQARYPGGPGLAAAATIQVRRRDAEEAARIIAEET